MKDGNRIEYSLAVWFLSLVIPPLLYVIRRYDHNTLTSWAWIFSSSNYGNLILYVFVGTLLAFLLSRIKPPERFCRFGLFFLSFLIILPLWNEPELILDASRYFTQAKYLELKGVGYFFAEWGGEIDAWTDLPGIPFIYGLIFRYIGEKRIYIQIFNTLVFALTPVVVSLIGKELFSEETGLYGGLFLLAIPYLPTQVPLMLVDVPTMFFFALSVYLYILSLKREFPYWSIPASVLIVITMLSKYSTWLMIPVFLLISLVLGSDDKKRVLVRTVWVASIVLLIFVPVFYIKRTLFLEQIGLLLSYQWEGLSRWQEGIVSMSLFQSHPFLIALAVVATVMGLKRKDRRVLILLWGIVFVIVFNARRLRYLIPLLPLMALLGGYGLGFIMDRQGRRFLALSAVTISVIIALFFYRPFLNRVSMVNIKRAGEYLDTLKGQQVIVYPLPQRRSSGNTEAVVPILDLFTEKALVCVKTYNKKVNETLRKSSLRFTWRTGCPELYIKRIPDKAVPILFISSEPSADFVPTSGGDVIVKQFNEATKVFRFKTFVTVVVPAMARTGQF